MVLNSMAVTILIKNVVQNQKKAALENFDLYMNVISLGASSFKQNKRWRQLNKMNLRTIDFTRQYEHLIKSF